MSVALLYFVSNSSWGMPASIQRDITSAKDTNQSKALCEEMQGQAARHPGKLSRQRLCMMHACLVGSCGAMQTARNLQV
jgi:hypothetical protein